jgi:hypothetical protein
MHGIHLRFDYGAVVPWVDRLPEGGISALGGPERVLLRTPALLRGENLKTIGEFEVGAGETIPFVMSHGLSHIPPRAPINAEQALQRVETLLLPMLPRGTLDRCCQRLSGRTERRDLHPDGRHRSRADDIAAGATSWRSQLGLPVLLAARRNLYTLGFDACRLLRRGD